jgi:hypothetical protein
MAILIAALIAAAVLAVAWWAFRGRGGKDSRYVAKAGTIWLHDPTGNVVPEEEGFKKPPDEGNLL